MRSILACRPVNSEILERLVTGTGMAIPEVYADSIQDNCETCGEAIWVGPRQAAKRAGQPGIETLCFLCAIATAQDLGVDSTEIRSLDNPEHNDVG